MSTNIPCISFQEFSDSLTGDIYGGYCNLFSKSPLRVLSVENGQSKSAIIFSRYDQVKLFLDQHQLTSKEADGSSVFNSGSAFSESLLFKNDPEHHQLKKIFSQYFRRVPVSRYGELAESMSRECFDEAVLQGQMDNFEIMSSFCKKLPLAVVTQLLGLPKDAREKISVLSQAIANGADHVTSPSVAENSKNKAFSMLLEFLDAELLERWEFPRQSLMANVQSLVNAKQISKSCAVSNIALLLFAGQETTAALFGSMIYCLASFPQQLFRLRQNRVLVDSAVEEVLRFESPLQRATFRSTKDNSSMDGFGLAKGEEVVLLIGAANRDERIFDRANEFIVSRTPNQHLSFGKGAYHCLGRQLAVIEARAVCHFLLNRFPSRWHVSEAQWEKSTLLRCLKTLYINFNAC